MKTFTVTIEKTNGGMTPATTDFVDYQNALAHFITHVDSKIPDSAEVFSNSDGEELELEAGGIGHDYRISLTASNG